MGKPNFKRRFELFKREDIMDWREPGVVYLTRWHLLRTPWFGIYLHCIRRPDADRHLHDHPWSFVSIVLLGGYIEHLPRNWIVTSDRAGMIPENRLVQRRLFSIARRRASDAHRITHLLRKPTWTLVLIGKKTRSWGFHTERGWVRSVDYFGGEA